MSEKSRAERLASEPTGEEVKALKAFKVDVTYRVYHSLIRIVLAKDFSEAAELACSNPWHDDVSLVHDVDCQEGDMSSENVETDPEELTPSEVAAMIDGDDSSDGYVANGISQWLVQHGATVEEDDDDDAPDCLIPGY